MKKNIPIPVFLVAGFLGSGKTTFIQRLLHANGSYKIGIILNESGEVKLESNFYQNYSNRLFEISSGCLCCVNPQDLGSGIEKLRKDFGPLDCILVECGGLTHPGFVLQKILENSTPWNCDFCGMITVMDGVQASQRQEENLIFNQQINLAQTVVITKTDLLKDSERKKLKEHLQEKYPGKTLFLSGEELKIHKLVLKQSWDKLSNLSFSPFEASLSEKTHGFESFTYQSEKPFDPKLLGDWLRTAGNRFQRGKGFFFVDIPRIKKYKYLLQSVGGLTSITNTSWHPKDKKENFLLFWGKDIPRSQWTSELVHCEI